MANKPYDRKLRGNRCQCQGCFEYFNSEAAFNLHRTGTYQPLTRRCLSTEEMQELGMSVNMAGFWITKVRTGTPGLAFPASEGAAIS